MNIDIQGNNKQTDALLYVLEGREEISEVSDGRAGGSIKFFEPRRLGFFGVRPLGGAPCDRFWAKPKMKALPARQPIRPLD